MYLQVYWRKLRAIHILMISPQRPVILLDDFWAVKTC